MNVVTVWFAYLCVLVKVRHIRASVRIDDSRPPTRTPTTTESPGEILLPASTYEAMPVRSPRTGKFESLSDPKVVDGPDYLLSPN